MKVLNHKYLHSFPVLQSTQCTGQKLRRCKPRGSVQPSSWWFLVRRLEFGKYFRLRRQVGDEEPPRTPCLYLVKTVRVNKTPWPPGRVVDRPTRVSFIKVLIVLQSSYQAPSWEKEWRLCGNSQKDRITWNSVAEKTNWSDLRDRLNNVHEHRARIFFVIFCTPLTKIKQDFWWLVRGKLLV